MNGLVIRLGIYERHILFFFFSFFFSFSPSFLLSFLRFMPLLIVRSMGGASKEGS